MTGDGNTGGQKLLCERCCIAKIKATRKEKCFTVIGLTNLIGEPYCCIVIIEGKEEFFDIRYVIDFYKDKVGDEIDGE